MRLNLLSGMSVSTWWTIYRNNQTGAGWWGPVWTSSQQDWNQGWGLNKLVRWDGDNNKHRVNVRTMIHLIIVMGMIYSFVFILIIKS